MAKKGINTDFKCPMCGSSEVVVGKSCNVPNGELNYTLRCGHCATSKDGDLTYVKNIPQVVLDSLIAQNRILAEPKITNGTATSMTQNAYGSSAMPPAFASRGLADVDSIKMAEQQQSKPVLGSVMPPPKEFGREMNPDDSTPFENSVPTTNDPNVPPPFIPNGSSCAACQRNLAVKVSGTRYVSRVNNDRITYSDELTGTVVLTQHVSFCPYCGRKLS